MSLLKYHWLLIQLDQILIFITHPLLWRRKRVEQIVFHKVLATRKHLWSDNVVTAHAWLWKFYKESTLFLSRTSWQIDVAYTPQIPGGERKHCYWTINSTFKSCRLILRTKDKCRYQSVKTILFPMPGFLFAFSSYFPMGLKSSTVSWWGLFL